MKSIVRLTRADRPHGRRVPLRPRSAWDLSDRLDTFLWHIVWAVVHARDNSVIAKIDPLDQFLSAITPHRSYSPASSTLTVTISPTDRFSNPSSINRLPSISGASDLVRQVAPSSSISSTITSMT